MLIPPQMIKQEINREVARETNIWRSQLVRAFNQLYRDTLNAKTEYEKAPCPAARDKLFAAIGQLQGYLEIRISLKQVYGDNTLNQARGLIHKLTEASKAVPRSTVEK